MNKPIKFFIGSTLFFLIITILIGIDHLQQSTTRTDLNTLALSKEYVSTSDTHLQQLGFSNYAINAMGKTEKEEYGDIRGKVVNSQEFYEKISAGNTTRLSKEAYQQLLKESVSTFSLEYYSLVHTTHRLIYEGNRTYTVVSEYQVDRGSYPLEQTTVEMQYNNENEISDQRGKLTWWTKSLTGKIEKMSNRVSYDTTPPHQPNEMNMFFENDSPSNFHIIKWPQGDLFHEIIGQHLLISSRFTVPKEYYTANMFIQVDTPHQSVHLQHDLEAIE